MMTATERFRIVANGWQRAHPIWEIMENAKLQTPKEAMDLVRAMQLPERHLTTRDIIEPHQFVEGP